MKARLRKYVRETLAMTPGYGHTEKMIVDAVNERLPVDANLTAIRDAIEWNHGKAYLRQEENEDTEQIEYSITKKGLAKEAIT